MALLTDAEIAALKAMPKTLLNPGARPKQHGGFIAREYQAKGPHGEDFRVYTRQNASYPEDFSTGIRWVRSGADLTLARYNGSSHVHRNAIEGDVLSFVCHIHHLTERYQVAGRQGEGFASATVSYGNLEQALTLLIKDWNIAKKAPADSAQPDLYDG